VGESATVCGGQWEGVSRPFDVLRAVRRAHNTAAISSSTEAGWVICIFVVDRGSRQDVANQSAAEGMGGRTGGLEGGRAGGEDVHSS